MEAGKTLAANQVEIPGVGVFNLTSEPVVTGVAVPFVDEVKASAEALKPIRDTNEKIKSGLKKRAVDALTSAEKALIKYREMLAYIREHQIPPPVVHEQLKLAGFVDSRISEVKRVAMASDEIYQLYASGAVGFKLAVDKARGEKNAKKKALPKASAHDLFEKAVRHAVEDAVPVAGKLPKWCLKMSLQAQGCNVAVFITRLNPKQEEGK